MAWQIKNSVKGKKMKLRKYPRKQNKKIRRWNVRRKMKINDSIQDTQHLNNRVFKVGWGREKLGERQEMIKEII